MHRCETGIVASPRLEHSVISQGGALHRWGNILSMDVE